MLNIAPTLRSTPTSAQSGVAPHPSLLDELRAVVASPAALDEAHHILHRDGVLSIPMTEQTKRYLQARMDSPEGWRAQPGSETRFFDLRDEPIAAAIEAFAEALVNRIRLPGTAPLRLRPQEIQLRRPEPGAAEAWHQDRAPKVLTCVATLHGNPTEYVSPTVGRTCFEPDPDVPILRPSDRLTHRDIGHLRAGEFHVIAALGLDTEVPMLVHRAPPQTEGRTIFLARWRAERPSDRTAPLRPPGTESAIRREAAIRAMIVPR